MGCGKMLSLIACLFLFQFLFISILMSIFEQLQNVIAVTLKVSPADITESTTADDMSAAWDSLGHVNLMMALEQTFDIFLDVEDFAKLNSVPAILKYLQDNGAE